MKDHVEIIFLTFKPSKNSGTDITINERKIHVIRFATYAIQSDVSRTIQEYVLAKTITLHRRP